MEPHKIEMNFDVEHRCPACDTSPVASVATSTWLHSLGSGSRLLGMSSSCLEPQWAAHNAWPSASTQAPHSSYSLLSKHFKMPTIGVKACKSSGPPPAVHGVDSSAPESPTRPPQRDTFSVRFRKGSPGRSPSRPLLRRRRAPAVPCYS